MLKTHPLTLSIRAAGCYAPELAAAMETARTEPTPDEGWLEDRQTCAAIRLTLAAVTAAAVILAVLANGVQL